LAFAAGQHAAALADAGFEPVGVAVDEVERLRVRRGVAPLSARPPDAPF